MAASQLHLEVDDTEVVSYIGGGHSVRRVALDELCRRTNCCPTCCSAGVCPCAAREGGVTAREVQRDHRWSVRPGRAVRERAKR